MLSKSAIITPQKSSNYVKVRNICQLKLLIQNVLKKGLGKCTYNQSKCIKAFMKVDDAGEVGPKSKHVERYEKQEQERIKSTGNGVILCI